VEFRTIGSLTALGILLAACVRYETSPLTDERVEASLGAPDSDQVCFDANQFQHPLLPSIVFDDSDGLSPEEAAIYAVVAHPSLRAVRDRRMLAQAQLIQAGVLPNPELSLHADKPVAGDTAGTVNAYGAGLSWEISSLVGRNATLEVARKQAESVDLDVAWQEWQVAEAAKLAVYHRILAERRLSIAADRQRQRQDEFDNVNKGVALQERTTFDVATAEAKLERARWDYLAAVADRDKRRLALDRALGVPPDSQIAIQPDVALPSADDLPTTADALQLAQSRRLDLAALRIGYESEEARLRAAVQRQFPRIRLGFSGERDAENVGTLGIGVSIEFPIFDRSQGMIAREEATRQQLYDEYVSRVFDARSDIARLISEIASVRKQLSAVEDSLRNLKASESRVRQALRNGTIDLPTYFTTVSPYYDASAERLQLQGDLTDLCVALEIATGTFDLSTTVSTSPRTQTAEGVQP